MVSAICIITSVVMLELSNKLVYSYMVYLRYIGFSSVVSFVITLKYSINCLYYTSFIIFIIIFKDNHASIHKL